MLRTPASGDWQAARGISMRWDSVRNMNCSVARALAVVGERWTMLILREAFLGRRHFDEFQRGTGIARNILSSRLRDLVENGILERSTGSDSEAGRIEYRLTRKGLELYPVVVALMRWGDAWLADKTGPPMTLVHRTCGEKTTPSMNCSACGAKIGARDMVAIPRRASAPTRAASRRHAAQ